MRICPKIVYSSSLFLRFTVRSILSRIWSPLDLQRILSLYSTGAYPKILFIFCQNFNWTFWAYFAIGISRSVAFFASFVARFAVQIVVYKMVSRALVAETTRVSFIFSKSKILESPYHKSLIFWNFPVSHWQIPAPILSPPPMQAPWLLQISPFLFVGQLFSQRLPNLVLSEQQYFICSTQNSSRRLKMG